MRPRPRLGVVLLATALTLAACGLPLAAPVPTQAPTSTPREPIDELNRDYSGGRYSLRVPSSWNGGLIVYAHGYEGERAGPASCRSRPSGAGG